MASVGLGRKAARRFFVDGECESGACVDIGDGDARKIRHVLRLRDGDAIEVVDSAGTAFDAALAFDGRRLRATLGSARADDAYAGVHFDVAQALPKAQKMDFVVEKLTELGVGVVLPFRCERVVARGETAVKEERWRRIAASAARQCGRRQVPAIADTLPAFGALLERFAAYDAIAFAWELAPRAPLYDRLHELLRDAKRALLVVGPEGGFTHAEAEAACARGGALVWMGSRILRAETAAFVLLAVADAIVQGRNYGRMRRT